METLNEVFLLDNRDEKSVILFEKLFQQCKTKNAASFEMKFIDTSNNFEAIRYFYILDKENDLETANKCVVLFNFEEKEALYQRYTENCSPYTHQTIVEVGTSHNDKVVKLQTVMYEMFGSENTNYLEHSEENQYETKENIINIPLVNDEILDKNVEQLFRIVTQYDIYLAGPFFNKAQQRRENEVAKALVNNERVRHIFRPSKLETEATFGTQEWKREVFNIDLEKISKAQCVVMIANFDTRNGELILDPGTAVELGYAHANNIPVVLVVFDKEPSETTLNVMVDLAANRHIVGTEEEIVEQLQYLDFNEISTKTSDRKDWKTT